MGDIPGQRENVLVVTYAMKNVAAPEATHLSSILMFFFFCLGLTSRLFPLLSLFSPLK